MRSHFGLNLSQAMPSQALDFMIGGFQRMIGINRG